MARQLFLFFSTDAGDFTCLAGFFSLMWEILHACRESGRNSVQAGDSLSMRESLKPCLKLIHDSCILTGLPMHIVDFQRKENKNDHFFYLRDILYCLQLRCDQNQAEPNKNPRPCIMTTSIQIYHKT